MSKILWITGNSGSGKSTLAKWLTGYIPNAVWLDADKIRKIGWPELGYSTKDRIENNLRFAALAKELSDQGCTVIVSTICPYADLRNRIREMIDVHFIYLSGGKEPSETYPYEPRGENERP